MNTTRLPLDFKEFLKSLNEQNVKYLLVGGYAVGYYGYPRATADIDVWIASDPQNAARVVAALKAFGFEVQGLSPDLFLAPDRIVRMGVAPMRIEILTSVSGVAFDTCYAERKPVVMDGIEVSLISLRHLKQNKAASGRHKDLDDLEHLP
ncbi:MAG TPA: nucleotidyltransferase [Rhodothermales bacterium]|nr:nucleotidyltransferase [Rhodothermales bacterium]